MNPQDIIDRLADEPVAVGAFVNCVLVALVAFGAPLRDDQRTALLALIPATLLIAKVVRGRVTPTG